MPAPRRSQIEPASHKASSKKGALRYTYDSLTSAENRSVMATVTTFGLAVAFLSSSWADYLLPPV